MQFTEDRNDCVNSIPTQRQQYVFHATAHTRELQLVGWKKKSANINESVNQVFICSANQSVKQIAPLHVTSLSQHNHVVN